MKHIVIIFVSIIAMMATAQAEGDKIGYVNGQYIAQNSPQAVAIREKMQAEFKEQQEELKTIDSDYRKLQEKAQKDGATMSQQEKIDLSRKMQELETQLKLKQKALQEDMQRFGQGQQIALLKRIRKEIDEYAKANGYKMVINAEALLFADPALDISDKILAKLNSSN
ncbi:OmpH family outer membrane protein [Pleionea sediminis]|uniref:OmpH family outer membrane protein n=1 Tax=Pleionea sediminis TaxID=2569479 RepID=UPI0011863AFE|nr:OmpH family outer membrane protein [Pleionea sediminis]